MGRDPDKEALRRMMLARRDSTSSDMLAIASRHIRDRLWSLPIVGRARRIGAYHSMGSEVMTNDIMQDVLSRGRTLLLPAIRGDRMVFCRVSGMSDLMRGAYGIMEPKARCTEGHPDVLLVPAVCVTPAGDRLGYGGGYYDGYLAGNKIPTIVLSLEKQVVNRIPYGTLDVRADLVVTEDRTYGA